MARPIFGNSVTGVDDNGTAHLFTLGIDVGAQDNLVIVFGLISGPADHSPTFGGQSMELLDTIEVTGSQTIYIFYLINPPTGSQIFSWSTGTNRDFFVVIDTYSGVNANDPVGAVASAMGSFLSGGSNTLTPDSTDQDIVIDVFTIDQGSSNVTVTPDASQTSRGVASDAAKRVNSVSDKNGANGTTSMTQSVTGGGGNYGHAAFAIKGSSPQSFLDVF